jgi:hypothetical protein
LTQHAHDLWRPAALDARFEECAVRGCNFMRRAATKLDPVEARENRDEDIRRVDEWSDAEWRRHAFEMGKQIAQDMIEFTSDEFWRRGLPKPREPRALGPIMLSLQRDRFIESTNRLVNTSQVLRNAAPVRVWRSLVYQPRMAGIA